MLKELYIKNMAVIDEIRLEFAGGFQVLTGETGAGKSILVEAIGLILGNKADASLIRDGADEAVVEACFTIGKKDVVLGLLSDSGLENPDDASELIIRRVINKAGKNKVFMNQQRTTLAVLQNISALLIDFTGQHEQMELLDSQNDVTLIDSFLPDTKTFENYVSQYTRVNALHREIAALEKMDAEKAQRLEWLKFQLVDFEKLLIETPEQEDNLKKQRERLRHQTAISQFERLAAQTLAEEEGNCLERVNLLIQSIQKNPVLGQMFAGVVPPLEEIKIRIEDVSYLIAKTCGGSESSVGLSQDEIESMLFHLEKLKRRFGPGVIEVQQKKTELLTEQEQLKNSDATLERAQKNFKKDFLGLITAGNELAQARQKIKTRLEKLIREELKYLQMPGVEFVVEIKSLSESDQKDFSKYSARGADHIQFLLSPNPGLSPRPLAKIASGGETSRIFLALKQVLSRSRKGGTLIFDEIDTGISGAAVELVGHKLKSLASDFQVFCVTHHAQIASQADQHYFVQKTVQKSADKNHTITRVKTLNQNERIHEIARLMGGVEITKKNLDFASEMLGKKNKK